MRGFKFIPGRGVHATICVDTSKRADTYLEIYTRAYKGVCAHVYMCVYIYICVYTRVYMRVYIHTHMFICAFIHI